MRKESEALKEIRPIVNPAYFLKFVGITLTFPCLLGFTYCMMKWESYPFRL